MRRMPLNSLAAVVVIAMTFVQASAWVAADAQTWRTYHNERYGTTIEYPDFFAPQPPPTDGDGLEFKSPDGADFSVFASYNALDFDLAGLKDFILKNLKPGEIIGYQAQGNNWFVISGTDAGDVVYERHLLSHRGQITEGFVMSYPSSLKQTYDPIVTRMSRSFRAGSGYQTPGNP
jgi:hypothetical protein